MSRWLMRVNMGLALVVAVATAAHAEPDAATKQKAKDLVDAGVVLQKDGKFALAIANYEEAYRMTQHPVLLFNIAQAHRLDRAALAGRDPEGAARARDLAREYYRKFIDAKQPDEGLENTARGWLSRLDDEWKEENPKEEAARRDRELAEREAKTRAEEKRLADERHAKEARDKLEQERIAAAVREQQQGKARGLKIGGLATMGAGIVATGVGVYFGVRAKSISDDLTAQDVFDPDRMNEGDRAERYMTISYVTGGALLVGGAVMYMAGRRIGERAVERIAIVPVERGGAIATAGWQF